MAPTTGPTRLLFPARLSEGVIRLRPNRFVMLVELKGRVVRCHCPTTGRLGDLRLPGLRCLVSKSANPNRKTGYTVEAISLAPAGRKGRVWIGINQTAANAYVNFFLVTGQLKEMVAGEVRREVKLGHSRIDFKVGDTFLEVKTPLIMLPPADRSRVKHAKFDSFDRLIRHFGELSSYLSSGGRAIVALCYLYDAPPFVRPARDRSNSRIVDAAEEAAARGVENWQINMHIDPSGVSLIRCFRLDRSSSTG
jgi:sugar fermentation stimulation protein A